MIDMIAARLALRTRARGVVVATTGSATLEATVDGYKRSSGSFVTDGFYPGMEVTGVGYGAANNAVGVFDAATNTWSGGKIIKERTAGLLTIVGGLAVESPSASRRVVCSLPIRKPLVNVKFEPQAGFPYFRDKLVPGTQNLFTFPRSLGKVEETGIYFLSMFGLAGYGENALLATMDALKALFTPGSFVTAGSNSVTVRGDVAPQYGEIIPLDGNYAVCTLQVPWYARSQNVIAA